MFKIGILMVISIQVYLKVSARDTITINFIRDYVENEWAPTIINYNLCWKKSTQIRLFRALSEKYFRVSSMSDRHSKLQVHYLLFLHDLNCLNANIQLNESSLLRSPYRWLVFHDTTLYKHNNKETIMKNLLDLPLLPDSDFVLAERNGDSFTLTELHKASSNGPTHLHLRGYFNGSLIDVRSRRELFWRRKDIMGHPLTMSNVVQDSNTTLYHLPREDRLLLDHDPITKLCWIHVRTAFSMLNATPRYIFSHRWGYIKDGQWSGMINDLRTGKADIGTNCVANSKRLEFVVFTDSIGQFGVKFVFRQPPLSYVANIFSLPFSMTVWISILLSMVLSTATIYLASQWEAMRMSSNPSQLDGSVSDALLLTMSALSQQGCSKEPKGLSGRIVLWVVFATLMALYAAYSANIVVLLQAPSSSIRTLDQLAQSGMTIGAFDADYNRFVFRMFKDPVRTSIFNKIEPAKGQSHYYNLYEGVEKIRQGLFAYHCTVEAVYRRVEETFLETEKCDLSEIDFLNARYPLVPIYKHSPYLELLRVALKRIRESGIQSALHRRFLISKLKCTNTVTAFSSVGLLNLRPVLYFMLYGIVLSIFILLIEIAVHKISQLYTVNI